MVQMKKEIIEVTFVWFVALRVYVFHPNPAFHVVIQRRRRLFLQLWYCALFDLANI